MAASGTKKKRRQLQINVQVPESAAASESGVEQFQNDLFSKSKPDSILFKYKQHIISNGLKAGNDFLSCLKFIKGLSASKNFEYALKE